MSTFVPNKTIKNYRRPTVILSRDLQQNSQFLLQTGSINIQSIATELTSEDAQKITPLSVEAATGNKNVYVDSSKTQYLSIESLTEVYDIARYNRFIQKTFNTIATQPPAAIEVRYEDYQYGQSV